MFRRSVLVGLGSVFGLAGCMGERRSYDPSLLVVSNYRQALVEIQIRVERLDDSPDHGGNQTYYQQTTPIEVETYPVSVEPESTTQVEAFSEPGLYYVTFRKPDESSPVPYDRGAWHRLYDASGDKLGGSQMGLSFDEDGGHIWSFTAV